MTARSDEPFAVDALVRLEEVNQRRKLPRVGRILRPIETPNVWDHDPDSILVPPQVPAEPERLRWDNHDYLALAGVGLMAVGLVLSCIQSTRTGGLLVPIGAAALAIAGYAARRKDKAES